MLSAAAIDCPMLRQVNERGPGMDIYEAIRTRRSIRSYRPDPIPDDVLRRVMDAARAAPSANNVQPWRFVLVRDESLRRAMVPLCWNQSFIAEAPVVVAACGLPTSSKVGGYASSLLVDVAIAMDHLTLAARAEGLGTCWIGAFENGELKALLSVPKEADIVAVTPLGYPSGEFSARSFRKSLDEIVVQDTYDGTSPF